MPQPRECQAEFINGLKLSIGSGKRRVIGCASTGFGKSVVLASIVKQALAKRANTKIHARPYGVLIVLPRRSLVLQLSASFTKYKIRHGVIMAKERGDLSPEIQIASIDSLTARMESGKLNFIDADMLLIDECHAQFTKKKIELFERYPLVIGVTATPVAPGKQSLGDFYQEIVEAIPMRELIDMGWLSPLRYFSPTDFHPEHIKLGKDGDYSEKALINYVDTILQSDEGKKTIVGDIYENWSRIAPDRKTVVFCGTQAHAKFVVEEFRGHGINAEYVDCNTDDEERTRIFTGMEFGDIQVIANVGIIAMGVSIDNISCVVLATATKLRSKYLQCVGRGTRIYEGKTDCIVIDHCGIVLSLGFAEDEQFWSLDGKESPEERAKKANEEKKEAKEIKCVRCTAIFKSRRICPACGYEMISKGEAMPVHQADLVEMNKLAGLKKSDPIEKANFFAQLLHYSRGKGYADGYAAHSFNDKYGHYPYKKTGVIPVPPSNEVLNFIKYLQIKKAKGKRAA